jgi:DNA-binding transcriptional MocR family regulator
MITSINQFQSNFRYNTVRINFSFSNNKEIEKGVQRLSQVISNELTRK